MLTAALVAELPGALRTAGAIGASSIGDRVYNDLNGNGADDGGEPGLVGINVSLLGAGGDGIFGTGDDASFSPATTAADGLYSFIALSAGTYRVSATAPTGFSATTANPMTITLGTAELYTTADFGFRQTDASIGGLVFDDANGDGGASPGESGLGGVTLSLGSGSTVVATTGQETPRWRRPHSGLRDRWGWKRIRAR